MKLILENGKFDIIGANACGIYGFMFPDNKWLVGYSTQMATRLGRYFAEEKLNTKFKEGIKKYGWPAIKLYVLEECANEKSILLQRELFWSEKLDSHNNGYNVVPCGDYKRGTNKEYDDIFRKKVSEGMKRHHAKNLNKQYSTNNNWMKLWKAACQVESSLSIPEDLGTIPSSTDFGVEWNRLSKWNRKRIAKNINLGTPTT